MTMTKRLISITILAALLSSMLIGCSSGQAKGELTVVNYSEYLDPEMLDLFTKETGIKVNYEEALTPEEMYAKYSSGAVKYDLVCSSDYMMEKLIKDGELKEIPWDSFENKGNIGQKYFDLASAIDAKNAYTLPYFWGTLGILYDTTKVKAPVDSWDVLFNGDYAGQVIMQNSMRDSFMVALKKLGYSVNTENPDELKEAQELLLKQKPDVQAYLVDEARDEVVAGNAIMAVVYSGEAYLGHEYNENLTYVVPKEGSNVWIDCFGITKHCQNPENAAKFLDFLCREDVAKANFEYIYYSTPNEKVIEGLSDDEKADETLVPPANAMDNCEVCVQQSPETTELMNELWKEIKAE